MNITDLIPRPSKPKELSINEEIEMEFENFCKPMPVPKVEKPLKEINVLEHNLASEFDDYLEDINTYRTETDFFEIAQADYEEYLLKFPNQINENVKNNREKYNTIVNDILNSIKSNIAEVGKMYYVLYVQAMISHDGPMFTMGGSEKLMKLISIDKKELNGINYNQFTFNDKVGGVVKYPEHFVVDNRYLKTFLLTDKQLISQFRTFINLKLDNKWYVTDRIINESWLKEDGRIVQNVNTTQDVGMDEIAIQAKKMGFKVTRDGVSAYLTPNGAHPNPVVVESKLQEIKMGPKSLQKQVDDIYYKTKPMIGVELEVCKEYDDMVQAEEDGYEIPADMDIYDVMYMSGQSTDSDDFEELTKPYMKWVKEQEPDLTAHWSEGDFIDTNYASINHVELSFGAFLNSKGYDNAQDLYHDNEEWMPEPSDPDSDGENGSYSKAVAKITADEMDDYGIEAQVEETYHSDNRPKDAWVIEPDDSIRPNPNDIGMEIISPPQGYKEGMLQLEDMLAMFRDGPYYTNDSTGLHINVSLEGVDFDNLDYTKLVLLAGDNKILQDFDREINNYSNSAMRGLTDYLKPDGDDRFKEQGDEKLHQIINAMRAGIANVGKNMIGNISLGGHVSIEIKPGYIEFRSAGNTNYEYNDQGIITAVNRFIVAFVAASDPTAYKKEYAKKLYKVLSNHLPATGERLSQHAMQLFAMNKAGHFDTNRLKEKLKELGAERGEVKSKATTAPFLRKIIQGLENHYGNEFDTETYISLAQDGLQKEMKKTNDIKQASQNVIRNISDDYKWYSYVNNQ